MKNRLSVFVINLQIVYALVAIGLAFYTFDKGLVTDDEGWYLYLMKDLHTGTFPSQFHKLFNNVFSGDIYLIRIMNYLATILSITVFCYGLYNFLKQQFKLQYHDFLLMFCFCLLGFSIFSPRVCDVFLLCYLKPGNCTSFNWFIINRF